MKQERDKPLLYWMLIRAFMPSVLLLLFFLIFFLVVLNFASRHNQELRLGNQQAKLELAMQDVYKRQGEESTGITFDKW